jgi:hypothetical protein
MASAIDVSAAVFSVVRELTELRARLPEESPRSLVVVQELGRKILEKIVSRANRSFNLLNRRPEFRQEARRDAQRGPRKS